MHFTDSLVSHGLTRCIQSQGVVESYHKCVLCFVKSVRLNNKCDLLLQRRSNLLLLIKWSKCWILRPISYVKGTLKTPFTCHLSASHMHFITR